MKKFVPRQRKHKALARAKHASDSTAPKSSVASDSNSVSLPSITVTEAEKDAKRAAIRLEQNLPKLPSGKKAKRLEKYIENKLKKDENRELIEKLGRDTMSLEDTKLMASSKMLGQGRETKKQRTSRAMREVQKGLDLDGDNDDVLFKKRRIVTGPIPTFHKQENDEEINNNNVIDPVDEQNTIIVPEVAEPILVVPNVQDALPLKPSNAFTPIVLGGGLKRPLQVDNNGRPQLQKRQKRGGVKSKMSFARDNEAGSEQEEPEWQGFSSESEMLTDSEEELIEQDISGDEKEIEEQDATDDVDDESDEDDNSDTSGDENDPDAAEMARVRRMILNLVDKGQSRDEILDALNNSDDSGEDDDQDNVGTDISTSQGDNGDDTTTDSEDDSEVTSEDESEEEPEAKQQRSSAFKAWADEQRNQAMGFTPTNTIADLPKVDNFQPRLPEIEPLPLELQPSKNLDRKVFSVAVNRSAEIQAVRQQLPVVGEEQKIMEAIHNNSTIVIYGATGSGKTTQVPQFLYESGYGSKDSSTPGMIGVTQPRRVAAVSMAKRVGEELGDHGSRVAYQIRFQGNVRPETAIKFMTDGVLLREVAQDIALRKYSAIVIDEAHERSVNTDILIGMMSRVVRLRDEMSTEDPKIQPLKLIIMSATLKITDFTENRTLFATPPPVLQAEGRQYPVTNHFARKTHHDYVEEAFRKVSRGHKKLPPGGFLVFMTGQNEITQLSKKLRDAFKSGTSATSTQTIVSAQETSLEAEDIDFGNTMDDTTQFDDGNSDDDTSSDDEEDEKEFEIEGEDEAELGPDKMHVLPLYSLLSTKEQLRVFEPPPEGSRLVVLATNVAETSLTIPGISFVFDCGRSKERTYDKHTRVQSFEVGWISKASASQRAGRAGRTGPGHCYKLYSSAVYERDFEEFAEPEILRMPIEGVVLQLKAMNLHHVVNFPFPTPPDRQSLAMAEKLLIYLTALTSEGIITPNGSAMSIFPLSPRFARILLIGHLADCLPYTIALVAALSVPEIFLAENQAVPQITPKEEDEIFTQADRLEEDARNMLRKKFNKVHHDFCSTDDKSDALKLLQVLAEYAYFPTEEWCKSHFVRSKPLREASQLRRQLTTLLSTNVAAFTKLKYQEKLQPPNSKQVNAMKQMIAAGFVDNVAMREDKLAVPVTGRRKATRAIDVPYVTLFPSHLKRDDEDSAVYIHPGSALAHTSPTECPDFIIYSYLQKPQAAPIGEDGVVRTLKTRMHALTDISGAQLAAVAKSTPLLTYGKPLGKQAPKTWKEGGKEFRECVLPRTLRVEGSGSQGWTLPAAMVKQQNMGSKLGWVVI